MPTLNLSGKRVLFIGPIFYDYHTLITSKIQELGANVSFFPERKYGFLFGILNTLNPLFITWYQKYYYYFLLKKIKDQNFTHFFLIRGYKIPRFFLKKLKQRNPNLKFIMYQWDSNINNPYFHIVECFDKFYSFDHNDSINNSRVEFLQLFYTNDIKMLRNKPEKIAYDFFCFASFTLKRYKMMIDFIDYCEQNNYILKTFCFIPYTTYIRYKYINRVSLNKKYLSFISMPRSEYLDCLYKSEVVVDINHSTQTGLSMRIIEAYGAGKKIFTTNTAIINNPIYSSNWVQFLNMDDIKSPNFNNKKDFTIDESLFIDNWIQVFFR